MTYIPSKGDIVWINFDPSAGKEIKKRRPALVVSENDFNNATKFAVVCPITSTEKNFPTRYTLTKNKTHGQVIIHQLKSIDFNKREIEYIESIDETDFAMIKQIIDFII